MRYLDEHRPRAIAHRGWHIDDLAGRENTLAAFRRAWDEGYRYLETDVHATADGVLVAFHDATLDRVTDGSGPIALRTSGELADIRVRGVDPLPRMEELLEALPDAKFLIDAKSPGAVGPLLDLLRETGAGSRVCIGSFSDRRLAALRAALGPDVATCLSPREVFALARAAAVHRTISTLAVSAQVPPTVRGIPVITPRFVDAAHDSGLEVHAWTIDEPSVMGNLLGMGVDGIMTDRPDLLRDLLQERGCWR